jgi:hypothetical protein
MQRSRETSKGQAGRAGHPSSQVEEAGGAPHGVAHAAEVAALERPPGAFHHGRGRRGRGRGAGSPPPERSPSPDCFHKFFESIIVIKEDPFG